MIYFGLLQQSYHLLEDKLSGREFASRSFLFMGNAQVTSIHQKLDPLSSLGPIYFALYILLYLRSKWDDVMMRVCNERLHAAETANALISLINFSRENRGD